LLEFLKLESLDGITAEHLTDVNISTFLQAAWLGHTEKKGRANYFKKARTMLGSLCASLGLQKPLDCSDFPLFNAVNQTVKKDTIFIRSNAPKHDLDVILLVT
jgi:hypothetical protein